MASPRLKEKYQKEIVPALKDKFEYSSVMQVPKLTTISSKQHTRQNTQTTLAQARSLHNGHLLPIPSHPDRLPPVGVSVGPRSGC